MDRPLTEEEKDLIQKYEDETENEWDPDGPLPEECQECGELYQYIGEEPGEHSCYYIRCESAAAAAYEDYMHGDD